MSLIIIQRIGINAVFEGFVTKDRTRKKIKINNYKGKEIKVRRNSDRYILFKEKGLTCVCCGLTANKAYVEIRKEDLNAGHTAHINFYHVTIDGKRTIFTKDHIIPRSKGGPDIQENYQVMCSPCNTKKGDTME